MSERGCAIKCSPSGFFHPSSHRSSRAGLSPGPRAEESPARAASRARLPAPGAALRERPRMLLRPSRECQVKKREMASTLLFFFPFPPLSFQPRRLTRSCMPPARSGLEVRSTPAAPVRSHKNQGFFLPLEREIGLDRSTDRPTGTPIHQANKFQRSPSLTLSLSLFNPKNPFLSHATGV